MKIPRRKPLSQNQLKINKRNNLRLWRMQNEDKALLQRREYKELNREFFNNELKEWRAKNPESVKLSHRKTYFKINYGITPEQADFLLECQDGLCAICQSSITLGGKGGAKIDHCHETNKIRGILCSTCNTGLGQFKDNPVILDRAITYLYYHHIKSYDTVVNNKIQGEGEIEVAG